MAQVTNIGYLGVDVLNDAASCDEVCGLSGAGVGVRVASIGRPARPTPPGVGAPGPWSREVARLSPIRPWTVALDLTQA